MVLLGDGIYDNFREKLHFGIVLHQLFPINFLDTKVHATPVTFDVMYFLVEIHQANHAIFIQWDIFQRGFQKGEDLNLLDEFQRILFFGIVDAHHEGVQAHPIDVLEIDGAQRIQIHLHGLKLELMPPSGGDVAVGEDEGDSLEKLPENRHFFAPLAYSSILVESILYEKLMG
ncbi:MAG: hypothetical protein QM760_15020 [Nibricoccus sp.]